MSLQIRHLQAIVQVADQGGFSQAARHLHISQSAVSKTIADVEHSLGFQLFIRDSRHVTLTNDGAAVLRHARHVLAEFDAGLAKMYAVGRESPERLRIGALASITAGILPSVVSTFRQRRPGVQLEIQSDHAQSLVDKLIADEIDLAIGVNDRLTPAVSFTPLTVDALICLFPQGHRFSREDGVAWKQLAAEPIVQFSRTSSLRSHTERAFREVGVNPEAVIETSEIAAAAGLVAAGLGVMIATDLLLPLTAFAGLDHRYLIAPGASRHIGVIFRSDREPSRPTRELTKLLQSIFRQPQQLRPTMGQ